MVKVKRGTIEYRISRYDKIVNYMALPGMGSALLSPELLAKLKGIENSILISSLSNIVCTEMNVKFKDVQKKTRKRELVLARHCLMYHLVVSSNMTLDAIGELLCPTDPLDHSTVSHGRDKFMEYLNLKNKSPYAETVREINNRINTKITKLCELLP